MDAKEEKKEEGKEPKKPADDAGKGDQPKTTTLNDNANSAAERLEKANERTTELLRQQEDLEARKLVSGTSEAGKELVPERSAEEKAARARIKAVADASGAAWGKNYE